MPAENTMPAVIAVIIVVIITGAIGAAVFWFEIKKKTLADLSKIFFKH